MEPDRRFGWSWWLGLAAIVLLMPVGFVFVASDRLGSSDSAAGNGSFVDTPSVGAGSEGIEQYGGGRCARNSDGFTIENRGMTSCRLTEWGMTPYLDLRFSVEVSGIDQGATVVFRLRESDGLRLEVALGRAAVVIRERSSGGWTELSSVPRPKPVGQGSTVAFGIEPRTQRVQIDLMGAEVVVFVDGAVVAGGRTGILAAGTVSIGAVIPGEVAVGFTSIEVTETW